MTPFVSPGKPSGIDRVWELAEEGYRIVDVDSDDAFVGIRMERRGRSLTLLLTKEDFAAMFPNLPPHEPDAPPHADYVGRDLMADG